MVNTSPPYDADDAPLSFPAPSIPLDEIGVDRWHYDLWYSVIRAAVRASRPGRPSYHDGLNRPAASRYGATTPLLLGWFRTFNAGREYGGQVKPFNFLLAFQARGTPKPCRRQSNGRGPSAVGLGKSPPIRPVAPFSRNVGEAAEAAIDRETGKIVARDALMTTRRL